MKIGLNLVFLVPGETGGMETYARELIPALLAERPELQLTAFVSREAAADNAAPWAGIPSVLVPVRARRRTELVRGEQQLLPRLAKHGGINLLHSLANTAPAWGTFRRVVTIHDLIDRVYPEAHARMRSLGLRVLVPLAARRSDRIIVPSTNTRNDVVRFLGISPQKVDVALEGVRGPDEAPSESVADTRVRLGLGERQVVLTLSAKRPHKNIARLLEAVALIPRERRPVLLLPGYPTPWEDELRRQSARLGIDDDTRFLGWVGRGELEALYSVAGCFVFPSLYEGFGLPVLEAMIRGVPVACSNRSSLPEVAGGAARLFDPERPAAIAEAIDGLLHDPEEALRLVAAGRVHARAFSWGRTARETLASYERAFSPA